MNEKMLAEAVVQARHDLRNPISHILGFAEMLLEQAGAQGQCRAALEEIYRLGNTILSLINQRLTWPVADLAGLAAQLREQTERIRDLSQSALRNCQVGPSETADDLLRIAQAAKELLHLSETALPPLHMLLTSYRPAPLDEARDAGGSRGKYGVLVIDDLEEIRQLLRTRLSELGYTVFLAESGPDALGFLQSTPVDVILLDIGMPGMDGVEVLRQLKRMPHTRRIPVLMLSFSEPPEQLALCLRLGAEGSIPKPFKDVLLQARLESVVGSH